MPWTAQDYVYVTAECLTGILTVIGNTLVLLAIAKTRSLRTVTNCFIGSLAVADVMVGLVIPPSVILSYVGLPREFYGCVLLNTMVVLITNISLFSLLAIALERFVAVKHPFLYQRVLTIKRALVVVVMTWILAILIGLIPTMGWNQGRERFDNSCSFTNVIDLRYMVYLIFFAITLPLLLTMLVVYLYIFYIVRKQQKQARIQINVLTRDERHRARQRKQEVRGAKGLAYVIILFAMCWLPLHIMNSVTVFAPEKSARYQLLLAAIILSHANSVVNPFLYAFSNSKFKHAMKLILYCGRQQAVGQDVTEGMGWVSRRTSGITGEARGPEIATVSAPTSSSNGLVISSDESTWEHSPEETEVVSHVDKLGTISPSHTSADVDSTIHMSKSQFRSQLGNMIEAYHMNGTAEHLHDYPEAAHYDKRHSVATTRSNSSSNISRRVTFAGICESAVDTGDDVDNGHVWTTPLSQCVELPPYQTDSLPGYHDYSASPFSSQHIANDTDISMTGNHFSQTQVNRTFHKLMDADSGGAVNSKDKSKSHNVNNHSDTRERDMHSVAAVSAQGQKQTIGHSGGVVLISSCSAQSLEVVPASPELVSIRL